MQDNNQTLATKTKVCSLDRNVAALLCYVPVALVSVVFSIIWLNTEKHDRVLRFHAMQGLALVAAVIALSVGMSIMAGVLAGLGLYLFSITSTAVSVAFLVASVICMVNAYKGQIYRLPVLADLVEKQL